MNLPHPLILASTSRYRAQLLSQLSWPYSQENPGVDEDELKLKKLSPHNLASSLSELKARAVFSKHPMASVIGSDQVCHLNGIILGKPGTKDKAIEQLMLMQGKTHELLTAVTVLSPKGEVTFVNRTVLNMRSLERKTVENYVDADSPLDCAGSYKLESRGIKLFESIETSDHTAIIGLPLIELSNVLVKWGYPI